MKIQGSLSQSLCLVSKEKDLEERPRNVEFGRIMYRVIDCDVKKIVHLDAQERYVLYLPALYSHLGLSIPWEWKTVQYLIILSRNSYKGQGNRTQVSWRSSQTLSSDYKALNSTPTSLWLRKKLLASFWKAKTHSL